jgi:hypothetical protein
MERPFSNAANQSAQQSTPSIFHGGFFLDLFGRVGSGPSRRARSSTPTLLALVPINSKSKTATDCATVGPQLTNNKAHNVTRYDLVLRQVFMAGSDDE